MINLFTVWNIKFRIHWSFFFIFAIIGMGESQSGSFLFDAIAISLLFVCVLLHELGHALTAKYYNIHTPTITLFILGGVAELEKEIETPKEEFWITFFGPLVNFVIFLILFGINFGIRDVPVVSAEVINSDMLLWLMVANFAIAIFNLIPAWPLDGGRILRALLGWTIGVDKANTVATYIAQLVAFPLAYWALSGTFSLTLLLIAVAVFFFSGMQRRDYNQKKLIKEKKDSIRNELTKHREYLIEQRKQSPYSDIYPKQMNYVLNDNMTTATINLTDEGEPYEVHEEQA